MARRLNKRLLAGVLIFLLFPAALVGYLAYRGLLSGGDPKQYHDDAKKFYEEKEYTKAWVAIRGAIKSGAGKDPAVNYLLGQIAMKQNPPAVGYALRAYRAALDLKPDHVEAQRDLAELYTAIRYWKEAKTEIDRLIKLDPTYGKGYVLGGVVEMNLADAEPIQAKKTPYYEAAVKRYLAGIEKVPSLLDLYALACEAYERLGQKEKADEILNLAIANNPKTPEAYILKSRRLLGLDRADEAEELLKKGVQQVGDNVRLYVALGEVALRKRKQEAAREYFVKAVACDPKDPHAYLSLSTLHRMAGERDKAVTTLEQGLTQMPESIALLGELADLYVETRDSKKADEMIARIEKVAPDTAVVDYVRGKQALLNRQFRPAIRSLEQACRKQPTPQGRLYLARAYMAADELGAAQSELAGLVSDQPGLMAAWRLLAEVQLRLRDFEKAARSAKAVLDSSPDDTEMRLLLAQTLIGRQQPNEALKEVQTAAQRAKDDPVPYLLAGEIYRAMRRLPEAEASFRSALGTGKDRVRVYQRFAQFYRQTNQPDKAKALWEEVRQSLPPEDYVSPPGTPQEIEKQLADRVAAGTATSSDLLTLARLYQLTDRAALAKETLEKILAKAPAASAEWREAWQQLFLQCLGAKAYDEASALVDRLRKVDPQAAELLLADVLLALNQGQLDAGVERLRAVVKANPSLSQGHYLLGQVLVGQRKLDEAVVALTKAIELRPNLVPAHLLLARIYVSQGNNSGALVEANEALKFDPRLVPAIEVKAMAHSSLGAWVAAVADRTEIAAIVPENINNLIMLAALHVQGHALEKAEEVFAQVYKKVPDNPLLVRAFADFYSQTARPKQGEAIVEEYLGRHKEDADAYIIRGEYAAKVATPEEAEPFFRKAAALKPQDPYPLVFLGDQYSRIGAWAKAAAVYLEAVGRAKADPTPRKRLADAYMLEGKLDEAKSVVDAVLKDRPQDAGAMVVASRIAARQDRDADAKRYIEQALAAEPDYGEAKFRQAELYAGPDPMRAIDILATVGPADMAFEKAMLMRAEINTRRGQIGEAILDLLRLLEFRPTSLPGRVALASKYMTTRQYARAIDILDQLNKERQGKDPTLLVVLGEALLRMGRPAEALEDYQKARELSPEAADALLGETNCLITLKRPKDALDRIQHVVNVYPGEVWPRMTLVAFYEATGEPAKAMDVLRNGLLRREDWEAGYVRLAKLQAQAKQLDEARKTLNTGIAKMPKSLLLRTSLATMESALGRPEAAVAALKPVADEFKAQYSLSPEKVDALRTYAEPVRIYSLALYTLGRAKESAEWGERVWQINPTDIVNANNLAWVLATEFKDFKRAADMIHRCMTLVPNNAQVLDTAGWIAFLQGKIDEATQHLTASIKYGDNADARYHLGRIYEVRDRPDEARAEYQKALDMGLAGKDKEDAQTRIKALSSGQK